MSSKSFQLCWRKDSLDELYSHNLKSQSTKSGLYLFSYLANTTLARKSSPQCSPQIVTVCDYSLAEAS